jgi:hypothetical protein
MHSLRSFIKTGLMPGYLTGSNSALLRHGSLARCMLAAAARSTSGSCASAHSTLHRLPEQQLAVSQQLPQAYWASQVLEVSCLTCWR